MDFSQFMFWASFWFIAGLWSIIIALIFGILLGEIYFQIKRRRNKKRGVG